MRGAAPAMIVGFLAAASPVFAAGQPAGGDEVVAAVDAIRGRDLDKLSKEEKNAFADQLDKAWKVLKGHPRDAKPAVIAALESEKTDSFRIIDLAHLLLVLDPAAWDKAVASLLKADPNAYPDGFFQVASFMGAQRCPSCLPAVLRMLELEKLESYVPEHALTIDVHLGLIFTLGQYGDAALEGARTGLKSPNCAVRANAAKAMAFLLPVPEPPALRDMALDDACESARTQAWRALAAMESPSIPALAKKRFAATPPPSEEESKTIADALGDSLSPHARELLEVLAKDPNPAIAEQGKKGIQSLDEAWTPAELRKKVGSASPAVRSGILKKVRKATKSRSFDYEGELEELIGAVTPADLPLVNEARAAVLARISDECLYEYADLTQAARALRFVQTQNEAPPEGASAAPIADPSRPH